ncbi:MAG: C39 family peptidase [Candidatus Moraniibacteriota bacterium]
MAKNIKITLFLAGLILVVSSLFFVNSDSKKNKVEPKLEKAKEKLKEDNIFQENIVKEQVENKKESLDTLLVSEEKIPNKILIPVPFTSQAPFKKWDALHEEACEEASIIMLEYYFSGEKLTPETAEREIQALVKFQNKKFGDYKDTTAEQTLGLFLDFYGELPNGKKLKVVYDFDKTALKKYLARGFPIIIPAAGRELGNPNFTAPGPLYHNLVLVGYDGDIIITNDPGTRKGEGYKYNIDILYNAIHDFTGKPEDIKNGRKAMIVVE